MKILITGTPGVGKTTLAREASERFGIKHIDVSEYIKRERMYTEYDERYKTYIFNEKKVQKALSGHLSGMSSFIVDTHCVDVVRGVSFDFIFILTLSTEALFRRLKARGYGDLKVRENIECEIFGVVREDVEDVFPGKYYTVGEEDGAITTEQALGLVEQHAAGGSPG
jgi:adenylate kinase